MNERRAGFTSMQESAKDDWEIISSRHGAAKSLLPDRVLAHLSFDWNCPQHIVPRYTKDEIAKATRPLQEKLVALEAENAALRAGRAPRS